MIQKKLVLVAKKDSDYKVRIVAINNLYFKDEEILNYILEHDGYHLLKKKYLNGMHNTYSYHIFPVRDAASEN